MRSYRCSECGQLVFFENFVCLGCGVALGVEPAHLDVVALAGTDAGTFVRADGGPGTYRRCANVGAARCNWLVDADLPIGTRCASCELTTVRPSDADAEALEAFADAEGAKRRLLFQLRSIGLPVRARTADPDHGLAFELLSSKAEKVITGHESGVITLDLSESDDLHREFVRLRLGEPYRTVLGHFRHEIGHYYWPCLIEQSGLLDEFRARFGDERASYDDARDAHYAGGQQSDWAECHVSSYATMHPWEDWAETFAHYLHILDGLETAASYGLVVADPVHRTALEPPEGAGGAFARQVADWLALSMVLNVMSRSIGKPDLYPFVLAPAVIDKLEFVHRAVTQGSVVDLTSSRP